MTTARDAAPEIDRLVLGVVGAVTDRHGDDLTELARQAGLEDLDLLLHYRDFLLAGRLTEELAVLRSCYRPAGEVRARLEELEQKGLIQPAESGLAATERFLPVLEAMQRAVADVAAAAWAEDPEDVAVASTIAGVVAAATSDDHLVAAVHRSLPEPEDPFGLLTQRLLTLRYVRQHDHREAWRSRGLEAPEMVVMTGLWHGETLVDPGPALLSLVEHGYAEGNPARLTDEGRQVRQDIEDDTNERAQQTFDVLGDEAADAFLAALRNLPRP